MAGTCSWKNFNRFFHTLCIAITFALIVYWIYVYGMNEDLCTIDYKLYHQDKDDVYPTLSICFVNDLAGEKLKIRNPKFDPKSYLQFLKGNMFNSTFLNIDHDEINLNISEYVAGEYTIYRNGSYQTIYFSNVSKQLFKPSYSGFGKILGDFLNCFALQVPQEKEVEGYAALLKTSIFPNSTRHPLYGMTAYIHYPNQLMVSAKTIKLAWPTRERYDRFEMRFNVDGVEVLQRRNKRSQPCIENWKNYDDVVLVKHLNNVTCRSPYQMPSVTYPICDTKKNIKKSQFNFITGDIDMYPPCKAMEKVYYTFQETNLEGTEWNIKDQFWVTIYFFDHQFKNITKTR